MHEWRRDGPLGVLLSVINYIKTPQQYALFAEFQRLAHRELPTNAPAEDYLSLSSLWSHAGTRTTHALSAQLSCNQL
jgi:hypothetical protein